MRLLLAIGAVCLIGAGVLAFVLIDPLADESDPTVSRDLSGTACERLAGLAGRLAEADDSVNQFLLDLGQQAAASARGGRPSPTWPRRRNRISGQGVQAAVRRRQHRRGPPLRRLRARVDVGGTTVTRWIGERSGAIRRTPGRARERQDRCT